MRIVVLSDIHGNVKALEAVLADIRREAAPDAIFVAGDLTLVGPRPAEALALVRTIEGARFVRGNCDQYIIDREPSDVVQFVIDRLSDDDMAFVEALPFAQQLSAGQHELLVVHANPKDLETPIKPETHESQILPLLEGVSADLVAFGHYHVPFVRRVGRWTLADIASVGKPCDGDTRAVYAMFTLGAAGWQIEHRRVAFDVEAVAPDYPHVGFPHAAQYAGALRVARF
ncbi:MAG TPA: metallophosphoesterase family protein [Roseiflexaceae bacterium]|nr:metallophosphoesterase family protein [Roseiflexaceae bacterium]